MDIKMGQLQILRIFFENPAKEFHIRGIAKMLKIPKSSVSYHVGQLVEQDIIKRKETGVFPSFAADQTSEMYHFWKRQDAMKRMIESSLLDYLDEQLNPKCIVLFGSFAKAEYDKDSDIDIFVQAREKILDLGRFEKKLGHTINVFFEPDISKLSPELLNNIINGVKLRGFLKIR